MGLKTKDRIRVYMPCRNCSGSGRVLPDYTGSPSVGDLFGCDFSHECEICKGERQTEIKKNHPEYKRYYRLTLEERIKSALVQTDSAKKSYDEYLREYNFYKNLHERIKIDKKTKDNLKEKYIEDGKKLQERYRDDRKSERLLDAILLELLNKEGSMERDRLKESVCRITNKLHNKGVILNIDSKDEKKNEYRNSDNLESALVYLSCNRIIEMDCSRMLGTDIIYRVHESVKMAGTARYLKMIYGNSSNNDKNILRKEIKNYSNQKIKIKPQ